MAASAQPFACVICMAALLWQQCCSMVAASHLLPFLLSFTQRAAAAPLAVAGPSCRYGNFMQKGIELAKEAVEADNKQEWSRVGAGAHAEGLLLRFSLHALPALPC